MAESTTPRGVIKALLRGEAPHRPLLMPIIFSLGSRLESLALRDFHSNPTKIANALRQIRSVLNFLEDFDFSIFKFGIFNKSLVYFFI